jgi:hypothetical protein
MHGFLQAVAQFYADRVVYVFENTRQLMELPRLPLSWTASEEWRAALAPLRRLYLTLLVEVQDLAGGTPELTQWGRTVWPLVMDGSQGLYGERVWEPPTPKARLGSRFADSVHGLPRDRCHMPNQQFDKLAQHLQLGLIPKGLDFDDIKGPPVKGSTHKFDAWHDGKAARVYGHWEGATFVLDRFDEHL